MKIYLNKKDRIIHNQKNIIRRLQEENEHLRNELAMCDTRNISEKAALAEAGCEAYMELISELENIRHEYLMLINDMGAGNVFSIFRTGGTYGKNNI